MMEDFDARDQREDLHSNAVRAGKRTYFFDVKATRNNELYLTITESKKRFDQNSGHVSFEKHKLFLYREDFDKFLNALKEAYATIETMQESIDKQGKRVASGSREKPDDRD